MTQADAEQLLESVLAALCDQLRVPTAFVEVGLSGARLVNGRLAGAVTRCAKVVCRIDQRRRGAGADIEQVGEMFVWHCTGWSRCARWDGERRPPAAVGDPGRARRSRFRRRRARHLLPAGGWLARVLEDMQQQAQVFLILEGWPRRWIACSSFRASRAMGICPASQRPTLKRSDRAGSVFRHVTTLRDIGRPQADGQRTA